MVSEQVEEYLECIFHLGEQGKQAKTTELAKALGVSPASVTEMMQKLDRKGFVKYKPYKGVELTPKGLRVARKIKRKHRLLERFLVDMLHLKEDAAHEEACRMEHDLSDEAERELCKMLNRPETCPGNSPIPPCDNADMKCEQCVKGNAVPLDTLKPGEKAIISHVVTHGRGQLRKMLCMGFVPDREVTVEEIMPLRGPVIVSIEGTKVALGREYAKTLHVWRE